MVKDYQLRLWGGRPGKCVYILISGKAGVGKSTSARLMSKYLESLGFSVYILPFARQIKLCARNFFGWGGEKDERGRRLLQRLGTDVGREYDPDLWVKSLIATVKNMAQQPDFIIADDWRYPNEYSYFSTLADSIAIKVRVEGKDRQLYAETSGEGMHQSEISLPTADEGDMYYNFVIDNSLSTPLENLEGMCKKVIDIILERKTL